MNLRHNYQSRHISRTFIYLLIFILLFLFLLWWNSIPENVETPIPRHGHGHKKEKIVVIEDKIGTKSSRENIKSFKQIENPIPLMPVEIPPKKKANIVHLTIYMEAQCPDTTGFIRRQLLPSWSRLGSTKRLNITLVPFGKASCVEEADDYKCDCQHGKDECELNQLMNCAIEHLPDPDTHIPLIGCVQGKDNLISAFRSCLNGHTSSDLLWTCSIGKHGRRLHALAGNKTYSIGDSFNFVPWVVLNGQRENDAFYALEENLCKRIDEPIPKQCLKFL